MSREIEFSQDDYTGSNPLYAVAYRLSDGAYVIGTSTETFNASHWTSYAIALTLTAGLYVADFPAVPNDDYFVRILEQVGNFPATSDDADPLAEGILTWTGAQPVNLPTQFDLDSTTFFNLGEFAEPVTYNIYGGGNVQIPAIVDRHPPDRMQEDGHTLTNYIEVDIPNNATNGVIAVNNGKDTITLTPKFGGTAKALVITKILAQDAGAWKLAVR